LYILQESLFSFEDWLKLDSYDRLSLFFSALDLRPYAKRLRSSSLQGAKPINREAILRCLLAAPQEGISTFTALHDRLVRDFRFRYQCGFRLDESAPSISTLSRVFAAITELGLAKQLFTNLVSQCQSEGIIDGTHLAIDSTAVSAYEKKQPKSRSRETGNANWGAKFDTFGNKLTWFGYKIHLAVDTRSELPMAVEVTPAHVYDGEMAAPLMKEVAENSNQTFKFVMMDAGYDQLKNYEAARSYGAQAITAMNLRNEKEPPAGMTSTGTPCCSMGFQMTYWGADGKRLKFRCPHAAGKVNCPHGSAWCSDSSYGMVTKVNLADDIRRYSSPHRDSNAWKELYKERTSVERCNSRLKTNLTANDAHVGGIQKFKTHVYFNVIVLLASALAISKKKSMIKAA
jgi:transposase, IS5 family